MGKQPQSLSQLLWGVMLSWHGTGSRPCALQSWGTGKGGGKGMHRIGRDLKREQDGLTAKGSLFRNDTAKIAGKLARE
jgi:hypothetical protein